MSKTCPNLNASPFKEIQSKYGKKAAYFLDAVFETERFTDWYGSTELPVVDEFLKVTNAVGEEFKIGSFLAARGYQRVTNGNSLVHPKFLQSTSQSKEDANEELNESLKAFLATYGIKVEQVDNLQEKLGVDANGAALIVDKLILIAKGKEKLDTLPEEVAHFAVELLGEDHPMIKRLMDNVESTEIYETTYEEYKDTYLDENGEVDVHKIKKEAIGKAIASEIIKEQPSGFKGSFLKTLKAAWNKVMSIFKKMDHKRFNEDIKTIREQIVDNKLEGKESNLVDVKPYFQVSKDKKAEKVKVSTEQRILDKAIRELKRRRASLSKVEEKSDEAFTIGQHIKRLEALLDKNKSILGLKSYIKITDPEIDNFLEALQSFKEKGKNLSTKRFMALHQFIGNNESIIAEIHSILAESPDIIDREEIMNLVEEVNAKFSRIKLFYQDQFKLVSQETIEEMNAGRLEIADDLFEAPAEADTSWWRKNVGSIRYSNFPALKLIYNKINTINKNISKYTYDLGRELVQAQKELDDAGIKDMSVFFEKDENGKNTNYLISDTFVARKAKLREETEARIAKELGLEEYSEYNKDIATAEENAIANKIWKEFFAKKKQLTNPAFTELMNNPAAKKYYDTFLRVKAQQDRKLPVGKRDTQKYLLPQVRKDITERLRNKNGTFKDLRDSLKENFTESFTITNDDVDYNSNVMEDVMGKKINTVPVHYTRKLDNANDVSHDLTSGLIAYSQMAENFKQKHNVVADLEVIREAVGKRRITGADPKSGKEGNTYLALTNFLEMNLYGNTKRKDQVLKIGDKEINYGKALDGFNKYVRRNNLAFNLFSSVASYTTSAAFNKIEDIIGEQTTQESKLFAEKEFDSQIGKVFTQMYHKQPTNKMHLMFMKFGFVDTNFDDLNVNTRAGRGIKDIFYGSYQMVDYRSRGKAALAIMNNTRLVGGEFITKAQFKLLPQNENMSKFELNNEWKSKDVTFYDLYESKNKELVLKKEYEGKFDPAYLNDIENRITNRVEFVGNRIDGQITPLDRGSVYTNVWGRLIMTHRNWMVKGVEDRFKRGGMDLELGIEQEGYYRTTSAFLWKAITDRNMSNLLSVKPFIENFNSLSAHQKANTKRVLVETILVTAMYALIVGLENAWEDEDDWATQFALYTAHRTYLEVGAFYSPMEVVHMIKSPAAGINQLESITEILNPMGWFDEIERGKYKGMTKGQKNLLKRSYLKNFYDAQFPEDKLNFIKGL